MPTKRMFDLVIITGLLMQPVKGLFKMALTRKALDTNDNGIGGTVLAGAGRIMV